MSERKLRVFVSCACYDFPSDIDPGEKQVVRGKDKITGDDIEIEVTWQSSVQNGAGENFEKALQDNYDVIIVSSHANFGTAFDIESNCKEHTKDFPVDDKFEELAEKGEDRSTIKGAPKALVILSCNSAVPYGGWPCKRRAVTKRIRKRMPETNVVGSRNPMPFCNQADVKSIIDALKEGTKPGEINWKDHVKPHESKPESNGGGFL